MLDDALDNSAALTVGPAAQAGMNAVAVHGLAKPAAGEPELALRAFHIARSLRNMNRADKAGLALGTRRALAAAAPPLFASHRRTPFRARRSVRVARRYIKSGSSRESSSKETRAPRTGVVIPKQNPGGTWTWRCAYVALTLPKSRPGYTCKLSWPYGQLEGPFGQV